MFAKIFPIFSLSLNATLGLSLSLNATLGLRPSLNATLNISDLFGFGFLERKNPEKRSRKKSPKKSRENFPNFVSIWPRRKFGKIFWTFDFHKFNKIIEFEFLRFWKKISLPENLESKNWIPNGTDLIFENLETLLNCIFSSKMINFKSKSFNFHTLKWTHHP